MKHRLTIGDVRDILDQTGLDLLQIHKPEVVRVIQTDAVWIGQAVAVLGGNTELKGDDLQNAFSQIWQMLVDFYPSGDGDDVEVPDDFDPWREVYQAAGAVGMDPSPLSLRELYWMANGAWRPLMTIAAPCFNANASKPSDMKSPDDLNPYAKSNQPKPRRYRAYKRLHGK